VLDKYFSYRTRYVDYILKEAPARANLAVLSEVVRLAFVIAGSLFCAVLLWLLTAGAFARSGFAGWTLPAGLCAALATGLGLLAARALVAALADRARVRQRAAAASFPLR
jgi:hypothetical protein